MPRVMCGSSCGSCGDCCGWQQHDDCQYEIEAGAEISSMHSSQPRIDMMVNLMDCAMQCDQQLLTQRSVGKYNAAKASGTFPQSGCFPGLPQNGFKDTWRQVFGKENFKRRHSGSTCTVFPNIRKKVAVAGDSGGGGGGGGA